jgi:UDP-N-acetylmuramyl pentapeptide synthase
MKDILKKHFYFKFNEFCYENSYFVNFLEKFNLEKFKDYNIIFPYSINTDTRTFEQNLNIIDSLNKDGLKFIKIFVCIKGENFDSHNFIEQILEKNIDLIIIEETFYKTNSKNIIEIFKKYDKSFIVVNSSIKYLGLIANIFIKKVKLINDIKVIGITGSAGKTTTKNLLSNMLSFFFKENIIYSKKSFNNELGVPFTIFSINKDTKYLVLEMGMRGFNQINYLANISDVDYGIITSIGPAHVLQVGSIYGVNKAKGELIDYLIKNNKNFFILPKEYKILNHLKNPNSYVLPNRNYFIYNFNILNNDSNFYTIFKLKFGKFYKEFKINSILSKGILRNFLMSLFFINKLLNLDIEKTNKTKDLKLINFFEFLEKDLFNISLEDNRFNLKIKDNLFILDDCYNSNPLSMKENLNVVFNLINYFDKIYLIFGDMLELGKFSLFYHKLIFNKILSLLKISKNKTEVFLVGSEFNKIKSNKNFKNTSFNITFFDSSENLLNYIKEIYPFVRKEKKEFKNKEDKVLIDVKASRAIHLEKIVNLLL